MLTTADYLLGGRIAYRQPAVGFRSGIEPVLLAASIPVRTGEHVLEAGTGAGAALLCLTAREPQVRTLGVEADPALAELAAANAQANGFARMTIMSKTIETAVLPRLFDHAMANPPYHQETGTASPLPVRETAKRGSDTLIWRWVKCLSRALRARGSLTFIVPSWTVPVSLAAMAASDCACTTIFPLWPKAGRPAKLILIRGIKTSRAPLRLMPGLVLHQADGSFSELAQTILSGATALPLDP